MLDRLFVGRILTRSAVRLALAMAMTAALLAFSPDDARAQADDAAAAATDAAAETSEAATDAAAEAGDVATEAETLAEESAGSDDMFLEETAEDAAVENKGLETMVVSARKREDDLQKVPISVTAFSGQTLDVQRIDDALDIQFKVPNLFFGKTNFTGSNLQIRGIGSAVVASSGDPGIGIHVNEVPLTTSRIFEQEFYDIERIEVLRGPQGTLFGRNATGGTFNIYTKRPTDELAMNADVSVGNYASARVKGAVNVPIGDKLRTRVAGMYHRRNGYIDNLNTGNDIDDRSLYGVRGSIEFDVTDTFMIDGMVSWFDENDQRSRIGKQLCDHDDRPGVYSMGCTPNKPGTESLASYATLGGILENYTLPLFGTLAGVGALPGAPPGFATLQSLYTPGYNVDGTDSDPFDAAGVNPSGLREHFSRIDPSYNADELFANLGFNLDRDYGSFKALFGYQKTTIKTVQDYNMGIPEFAYNNPAGLASAIANSGLAPCQTTDPFTGATTDGILISDAISDFGCVDRSFAQDNSDAESEQISAEARFTSDYDGPFNFTTGAIYTYFTSRTDYKVFFSGAEILARVWSAYDTTYDVANLRHFNNESKPARTQSFGLFAEGDYEFREDWTLTGGIRYTNDRKDVRSRNYLLNGLLTGSTSSPPDYEKQEASWNVVTGRAIIAKEFDFDFADQSNAFISYSRGYKPGGFNPPAAVGFGGTPDTFDPEYINALELGTKNRFLDNNLQTNISAFFYDYQGYQISKIVNRTSVNENIDAFIWGVEAEFAYQLIEGLFLSTNFAYLGTTIRGGESIDPADPAAGLDGTDPVTDLYDVIKRTDNASNILCVRTTPGTAQTCAVPEPTPLLGQSYEDGAGNLNPGYVDGVAKSLDGNELPNSPKFQINLGASYSFNFLVPGQFTPRISWYWQSKMYGRLFNSERDQIESWSQADAGLRWDDEERRIFVDFWIKNFTNNDDITTHYFTDASSGNFTNVFLLEPLTVGGTLGFSF